MALSTRPVLKQSQSLHLTPQMQQSLKVLQMSRAELDAFVQSEIEANPLLQRQGNAPVSPSTAGDYSMDDFGAVQHSLQDHIAGQINLNIREPQQRKIAETLSAHLDETGYLRSDLNTIAKQTGTTAILVAEVLRQCQMFEPAGLFARNLAECLSLQLHAEDRLSKQMRILLEHLDLVAKRDFSHLQKLCNADEAELAQLLTELRRLNPKPGLIFDSPPALTIIPDILVEKAPGGDWQTTLNSQALPRILMNENYSLKFKQDGISKADKDFYRICQQKANWLNRVLDQRARTILSVATAIIERQQDFLEHGALALNPLTMQTIADAIGMHASTISRVAGQKYMMTPQGLYELRYFFNAAIKNTSGTDAFASEAVRSKIRHLIEQETAVQVLSDEVLAQRLKADGICIARRTIAKYREEMHIPSSAKRRRDKHLQAKLSQ